MNEAHQHPHTARLKFRNVTFVVVAATACSLTVPDEKEVFGTAGPLGAASANAMGGANASGSSTSNAGGAGGASTGGTGDAPFGGGAGTAGAVSNGGTGSILNSGGSSVVDNSPSGGAQEAGGTNSIGGEPPTGGADSGGTSATGGEQPTGGTDSGGTSATGGEQPTGGTDSGGTSATGGEQPTGGADSGGANASGGAQPTGGNHSGGTSAVAGSTGTPPAILRVYYPFDKIESDGLHTKDLSGNGQDAVVATAVTSGTLPSITPSGHKAGGINLVGANSQYVVLPPGIIANFDAVSVSCWIKLGVNVPWNRLFDFGMQNNTAQWMFFSPSGWNFTLSTMGTYFAINTAAYGLDPEMSLTQPMSTGVWHHVVVVLSAPDLVYYLDGTQQYRSSNMRAKPSDLGITDRNWLGRSVFSVDPYLTAVLDEFKLFEGALTAAEVATLHAQ